MTLAHQVQAFLRQSKRQLIPPETIEIANRLCAQGSPKDTPSNSQKETRPTLRSQDRGVALYADIWDVNLSRFEKAVDHLLAETSRSIRADPFLSAHSSPTRNSPESVEGYHSGPPIGIMAATIEESLAMVLQAMEGVGR